MHSEKSDDALHHEAGASILNVQKSESEIPEVETSNKEVAKLGQGFLPLDENGN